MSATGTTNYSSPAFIATVTFQSIAAVAGIAAIHAFVLGNTIRQKKKLKEATTTTDDLPTSVIVTLPEWATEFYNERKNLVYESDDDKMRVAMELSKINCKHRTGGPFGTAIFEYDPHLHKPNESKLFSIGVNRVVPLMNSTLHGEMTAIQFGQQKIRNFSFSSTKKEYHLYTSCAPCCQCLGGVLWSGVSKLVCGATKADAEAIGFSEGPVFDPQSYDALEKAGCKVVRGVLRDECNAVLRGYGENGEIYNP